MVDQGHRGRPWVTGGAVVGLGERDAEPTDAGGIGAPRALVQDRMQLFRLRDIELFLLSQIPHPFLSDFFFFSSTFLIPFHNH